MEAYIVTKQEVQVIQQRTNVEIRQWQSMSEHKMNIHWRKQLDCWAPEQDMR